MEAHLSATVEDGLLDSLSYRPGGNSANYVLETRKLRFFAEASDTFGPNSRVIRFRLVDQGFWEPAFGFFLSPLSFNNSFSMLGEFPLKLRLFSLLF